MLNLTGFRSLKLAVTLGALTLGLVACGSGSSAITTTPSSTHTLFVGFTGVSTPVAVTITPATGGTATTYTLTDGAGIAGLKGVYTVSVPAIKGSAPAAQTADLSSADQTITFAY